MNILYICLIGIGVNIICLFILMVIAVIYNLIFIKNFQENKLIYMSEQLLNENNNLKKELNGINKYIFEDFIMFLPFAEILELIDLVGCFILHGVNESLYQRLLQRNEIYKTKTLKGK